MNLLIIIMIWHWFIHTHILRISISRGFLSPYYPGLPGIYQMLHLKHFLSRLLSNLDLLICKKNQILQWHLHDIWHCYIWEISTIQGNNVSFSYNIELKIWGVLYIENKINNTQATFLTFIFWIPGAPTFTTFAQVSSYIYVVLLGIAQDTSSSW